MKKWMMVCSAMLSAAFISVCSTDLEIGYGNGHESGPTSVHAVYHGGPPPELIVEYAAYVGGPPPELSPEVAFLGGPEPIENLTFDVYGHSPSFES